MSAFAFLETALNAEGTATIHEKFEKLVEHATIAVDQLVAEEHEFTSTHLGQFLVHEDIEETYQSVQEPVGDVVIESIAYFSDVITSEVLTEAEKVEYIDAGALLIGMEGTAHDLLGEEITEGFAETMSNGFNKLFGQETSTLDKVQSFASDSADTSIAFYDSVAAFVKGVPSAIGGIPDDMKAEWATFTDQIDKAFPNGLTVDSEFEQFQEFVKMDITQLKGPIGEALTTIKVDKLMFKVSSYLRDNTDLTREGAMAVTVFFTALIMISFVVALVVALWKMGGKKMAVKLVSKLKGLFSKAKQTSKALKA